MRFIEDKEVGDLISMPEAIDAVREAFVAFGEGQASNLARSRSYCQGSSLSAMGAVLSYADVMGAKVYPTINGRFNFCVNLFSAQTGDLLAVVQGNTLTALRASATTVLAAERLAKPEPTCLALFGSGQQAAAHAHALVSRFHLQKVIVIDPHGSPQALCDAIRARAPAHIQAHVESNVERALACADVVVTATRSKEALFNGTLVRPGTFVAAIGSSKPDTREIDDALLARCSCIAVEDSMQALVETGDFVKASHEIKASMKVLDLGFLLTGATSPRI